MFCSLWAAITSQLVWQPTSTPQVCVAYASLRATDCKPGTLKGKGKVERFQPRDVTDTAEAPNSPNASWVALPTLRLEAPASQP